MDGAARRGGAVVKPGDTPSDSGEAVVFSAINGPFLHLD